MLTTPGSWEKITKHMINGNFRILKWRYVSPIFLAIEIVRIFPGI